MRLWGIESHAVILFIGEIKAGRDPRRLPSRSVHISTEIGDVATFLDAYLERNVKPAVMSPLPNVATVEFVRK